MQYIENETIANNDEEARCIENEKSVINKIIKDHCNFDTSIWDRKINELVDTEDENFGTIPDDL